MDESIYATLAARIDDAPQSVILISRFPPRHGYNAYTIYFRRDLTVDIFERDSEIEVIASQFNEYSGTQSYKIRKPELILKLKELAGIK